MELLWIIFVTGVAMTLAFYLGGIIDRKEEKRRVQEEQNRHSQWLRSVARFCVGAVETAHPLNAQALARYIVEYDGGIADTQELEIMREEMQQWTHTPQITE